ncbi:MAG: hypothetical protein MJ092_08240 [Lachnospiraceae bacterium]|nr:hypothetical protein [Lachnospiraceae bacterium]
MSDHIACIIISVAIHLNDEDTLHIVELVTKDEWNPNGFLCKRNAMCHEFHDCRIISSLAVGKTQIHILIQRLMEFPG